MRLLLFTLFTTTALILQAQQRCGTIAPEPEVFERWINQKFIDNRARLSQGANSVAAVYQIPVVLHVIEPASGGSLSISDERIQRQIEILNEDFGRTNADASNTPAIFLPVAADTEIQFVLAKQDPQGNPTSGIVRIRGTQDKYSATANQRLLRSESYWSPEHYLNIHVADFNVFLGYASFPITDLEGVNNSDDDYAWDGVFIDYQYFGENPSAPAFESYGRTTTHEIGHYLGLRHIWGDGGCSVDDFVADTPLADDDNSGLTSPCTFPNNDSNVCETDEMFQNYMDYTDDTCMNLFTQGQKTRMRTILDNSPRRTTLITSPGLSEPTRFTNDLAVTKIISPKFNECDDLITPSAMLANHGETVVTSYDLTLFVDGAPTQTVNQVGNLDPDQSEVVNFSSVSISAIPATIQFEISNVNGATDDNPANDSQELSLSSNTSASVPFSDNFESTAKVLAHTGSAFPWEVVAAPDESASNRAIKFKSFQDATYFGDETIFKTPVFDLTGINSAELKFRYAYAETSDSFWDGLAVKVSTDCGVTFSSSYLFNSYGSNLATSSTTASSFTPQVETQWQDTTINITAYTNIDGVQFAFQGINGGGNNIYIDNLSVVQSNLNEFDVNVLEVSAPLITCRENTLANVRLRNVGFEEITSLTYQYSFGGNTFTETLNNVLLISGQFLTVRLNLSLAEGANSLEMNVLEINGNSDDDVTNNTISYTIDRNLAGDSYPLLVDFEVSNYWTSASKNNPLWTETAIGSNRALVANGFTASQVGSQSWFISPALDVGSLDSAGLSFRASYANRIGFNDRLQVLMSIDCGNSYTFELLNADSDSLAVIQSNGSWIPTSDDEWKEFKIDLKPSIIWQDEIRLAFVFTNDNGNNLYIDDINIGIKPLLKDDSFVVFPNPAVGTFNVAFSLAERDDVQIQIIDLSGKVIFSQAYENVLNQVYDFEALSQEGFYFVKVTGKRINKTERLYIR